MTVDLPGGLRNTNIALVVQFNVNFLVIGVLIWDNCLFVITWNYISIEEVPHTVAVGFVVCEATLVVGAVGEDPSTFHKLVFLPVSN